MRSSEARNDSTALCIQKKLEELYDIEIPGRVDEFLIGPDSARNFYDRNHTGKIPPELLLVREGKGRCFEVGLYVDPKILWNLSPSLSDLCVLIEGVSHFNYLLWKGVHGIPVTRLELELQAEIDKFLLLSLHEAAKAPDGTATDLLDLLFDRFSLRQRLSSEERERYLTASSLASRFCYGLWKKYFSRRDGWRWITREVRHFYGLSQGDKISCILH